ncbi:MAG: hypothetical protein K1000chlam3_01220 [Chlamydiae bacterium]|nr:hypothetical protein [Chlamydiota bacterium]
MSGDTSFGVSSDISIEADFLLESVLHSLEIYLMKGIPLEHLKEAPYLQQWPLFLSSENLAVRLDINLYL